MNQQNCILTDILWHNSLSHSLLFATGASAEHFYGSCLGLIQLQSIYNLSMTDVAEGILRVSLTTGQVPPEEPQEALQDYDFYLVGIVAYMFELYDESVLWLQQAEDMQSGDAADQQRLPLSRLNFPPSSLDSRLLRLCGAQPATQVYG